MRRTKVILLMTICFLLPPSIVLPQENRVPETSYRLVDEQSFRNYKVRIYRNSEKHEAYLQILRDDKKIYEDENFNFRIGHLYDEKTIKKYNEKK